MEETETNEALPWSEQQAKAIGKNIGDLRERLRMSAETLSSFTEDMGHRVPRSSIQKMESGGKKTIVLHEALLIADVLGVPLGYLIYSPYKPADWVHLYPTNRAVPAYWAADKISPGPLQPAQLNNINSRAVDAVRDLAHYRSAIEMLGKELANLELAIPRAQREGDEETAENLEKWKQAWSSREADLLENKEREACDRCRELGVEPWSVEDHKIPTSYFHGYDPASYNPFSYGRYGA